MLTWSQAKSGSQYGLLLAHLGVAGYVTGVTLVRACEVEFDLTAD